MSYLLDVNVLIALVDPRHVRYLVALAWFESIKDMSFATCPITQNGVLRIVGNPRYPNSPGSPAMVAPLLQTLCQHPGHLFWGDDISLLDSPLIDVGQLRRPEHTTDSYLLALARHHGGKLATFDRRLMTAAVRQGSEALVLIS